jgi:hypothetical protein
MNGQRKIHSLLESVVNIVVGFVINVFGQFLIFPLFGLHTDLKTNMQIGVLFTFISIVRSYVLRRAFNRWHIYLYNKEHPQKS